MNYANAFLQGYDTTDKIYQRGIDRKRQEVLDKQTQQSHANEIIRQEIANKINQAKLDNQEQKFDINYEKSIADINSTKATTKEQEYKNTTNIINNLSQQLASAEQTNNPTEIKRIIDKINKLGGIIPQSINEQNKNINNNNFLKAVENGEKAIENGMGFLTEERQKIVENSLKTGDFNNTELTPILQEIFKLPAKSDKGRKEKGLEFSRIEVLNKEQAMNFIPDFNNRPRLVDFFNKNEIAIIPFLADKKGNEYPATENKSSEEYDPIKLITPEGLLMAYNTVKEFSNEHIKATKKANEEELQKAKIIATGYKEKEKDKKETYPYKEFTKDGKTYILNKATGETTRYNDDDEIDNQDEEFRALSTQLDLDIDKLNSNDVKKAQELFEKYFDEAVFGFGDGSFTKYFSDNAGTEYELRQADKLKVRLNNIINGSKKKEKEKLEIPKGYTETDISKIMKKFNATKKQVIKAINDKNSNK